jgi:nucleoside permease NupC
MLLAIGVLKITLVKNIFEFVGGIFVLILDFTRAGSEFLLGGMMDIDSFGFIFLLPTFIKVFPLLGIPLLGFLLYKLYKNWKRIANTAIDNYKRYHMKE